MVETGAALAVRLSRLQPFWSPGGTGRLQHTTKKTFHQSMRRVLRHARMAGKTLGCQLLMTLAAEVWVGLPLFLAARAPPCLAGVLRQALGDKDMTKTLIAWMPICFLRSVGSHQSVPERVVQKLRMR